MPLFGASEPIMPISIQVSCIAIDSRAAGTILVKNKMTAISAAVPNLYIISEVLYISRGDREVMIVKNIETAETAIFSDIAAVTKAVHLRPRRTAIPIITQSAIIIKATMIVIKELAITEIILVL